MSRDLFDDIPCPGFKKRRYDGGGGEPILIPHRPGTVPAAGTGFAVARLEALPCAGYAFLGFGRMDEAPESLSARRERLGRQRAFQHDDARPREGDRDISGTALFREGEGVPIPHDLGMAFDKFLEVHSIPKRRGDETPGASPGFLAKGF